MIITCNRTVQGNKLIVENLTYVDQLMRDTGLKGVWEMRCVILG